MGRTARAGKGGCGLLVLFPFERDFVRRELKNLNISKNEQLQQQQIEIISSPSSHHPIDDLVVNNNKYLQIAAQQAYVAFLGYYVNQIHRTNMKSKEELVHVANEMAIHVFGLESIPSLSQQMVTKMKLRNIDGLIVSEKENTEN